MVEKMQFLSLTGPKEDIDRVIDQYLSKYEIHLENALSELQSVADLNPFLSINPYKTTFQRAEELILSIDTSSLHADPSITLEQAVETIELFDKQMDSFRETDTILEQKRNQLQSSLDLINPFINLDFDISTILHFETVKFRFGKISKEYITKFETYVYENLNSIFYKCHDDNNYIWGLYFVLGSESAKIDAVYKSMHFERIYIPDEYHGTPLSEVRSLKNQIREINKRIQEHTQKKQNLLFEHGHEIYSAYKKLESQIRNFDVRKLAACTNKHDTFYILCGWMTARDAKQFSKELENDPHVYCILEEEHSGSTPPTKLKNPKPLRPFEMFIKMYGLPSYNEFDPTIFVALTYAFIFGWMFGDVGQGLCLAVGGFALYAWKKINLAAIIGYAGIFSTIFGFLFGSIFGFEDIIEPLWIRPVSQMSTLPFIGKLNTVFIVAIGFGMALILLTMLIHIINGIRSKDLEAACFDTNGLAGLIFYASAVSVIVLFMKGHTLPGGALLFLMFGIPLLLIAFKEPITRKLLKKKAEEQTGVVMTIVQAFFELFEVLLSYFSNTLSFVRIGAFAVSHAAMMEVVLMLAGAEAGAPNWIVIVFGNIFVCAMEGLIVGIQVLRLEYYELFSRFYKGNGREFKPFLKQE
ncbi:V-type ATP synthase subunit I [Clostridiales bacterium CHKCI001]|nr:V-type ATP synthase subunit I [Clostridiales bacterium CHKCI001]